MTAQSKSELMAKLRAKRASAGLVRMEVWIHPDEKQDVKAYAAFVTARRESLEDERAKQSD